PNSDVVGEIKLAITKYEDSFITLADRFDVGFVELVQANPTVDPWIPGEGTLVIIPSRHILPPKNQRSGIVINVAEMRMYYFPGGGKVYTYPLGIGRDQWKTPISRFTIIGKQEKPTWNVPKSIHEEAKLEGRTLPASIGPGPDNPLGEHAMRLSNPSYLIHGTNKPAGIGRRVSHGCINMFPKDVAELYNMTPVGTAVNIVHEPYKAGWANGYLWLESHLPLEDYQDSAANYSLNQLMKITQNATANMPADVDWALAKRFHGHTRGIPMVIGKIS
ncbi:MAG: L,D-transpeptidase, partial [Gammaproteobacteria bacterium]